MNRGAIIELHDRLVEQYASNPTEQGRELIAVAELAVLDADRRWFFPGRIENRGKSLPFTTREPDFRPTAETRRRADDRK